MADSHSLEEPVIVGGDELLDLLMAACQAAGTQAKWAAETGISAQYVTDVLKGRRAPGDSLLRGLGLRREVVYVPRGEVLP